MAAPGGNPGHFMAKNLLKCWPDLSLEDRETLLFALCHWTQRRITLEEAMFWDREDGINALFECNRVSSGHGIAALAIIRKLQSQPCDH
jgi:hypothetical protein